MNHEESDAETQALVDQLASDDMLQRMNARASLVQLGKSAVPAVATLASSEDDHVRWECAKTLSEIADASSVETLIQLLEDPEEGVRWDAAIGLIAIGRHAAAAPLLHAIIHRSSDYSILGGARHVMHEFSRSDGGALFRPVYEALNSFHARESAPVEAEKALHALENN